MSMLSTAINIIVPVYRAVDVQIPPCAATAIVITGHKSFPYSQISLTASVAQISMVFVFCTKMEATVTVPAIDNMVCIRSVNRGSMENNSATVIMQELTWIAFSNSG